jgi:hypothetical protein
VRNKTVGPNSNNGQMLQYSDLENVLTAVIFRKSELLPNPNSVKKNSLMVGLVRIF